MLPVHRNVNRFLGEFVSAVPDPMFDALPPLLRELGACLQCAHTAMAMDVCEWGWCIRSCDTAPVVMALLSIPCP
jgi:hypothetical protein